MVCFFRNNRYIWIDTMNNFQTSVYDPSDLGILNYISGTYFDNIDNQTLLLFLNLGGTPQRINLQGKSQIQNFINTNPWISKNINRTTFSSGALIYDLFIFIKIGFDPRYPMRPVPSYFVRDIYPQPIFIYDTVQVKLSFHILS